MSGAELAALLDRHGFDFFTGVPCSLVEDLIAALETHPRFPWLAAVREDVAVGLAAGAWLGGRRPVVVMQNSGLGTSLNALASLSLMYGLPALLLVTWRGYQGKDAPEHILMGEISPGLLDLLGIPHRVLSPDSIEEHLAWATRELDAREIPVALLVPPGVVVAPEATRHSGTARAAATTALSSASAPAIAAPALPAEIRPVISRRQALAAALKELGDAPAIHANGFICRESFGIGDRPQNFYMIGSMGLAAPIGLGVALARPAHRAVVFDGDGNVLMSLGTLAMVGSLAPRNLVHVVFDNEVYGSTGGQRSPSRETRLDRLALGAGYRTVTAATTPDEIALALRSAADGPHFVLVKVTTEESPAPRIPHTPRAIRDRFRSILSG
ncbi:MAG TPA: thiamine pyrophosphate-dependent enzyme [Methylomirabilota bacterium]|nr:thiamine pyrophosphate-dependent enzyme [Methylomirabilota bacterium]